jgi:hypothetical protein
VPLGQIHPHAARLDPERKRICDAIRISAYNAETALARMLRPAFRPRRRRGPHLAARDLLRPADIEIIDNRLEIRIHALSAPHRTRALAALGEDLTAAETTYPGTELTLVYSVKRASNSH